LFAGVNKVNTIEQLSVMPEVITLVACDLKASKLQADAMAGAVVMPYYLNTYPVGRVLTVRAREFCGRY